jgi:hypothetical protein
MLHIPTWDVLIATSATQLQITQLFVPFLQQHHLQLGQQQIHDCEKQAIFLFLACLKTFE